MFPPDAGTDMNGNIHIPFMFSASDIPFTRWQMISEKVWQSPKPVVIQSVIITHRGEVFIQYAMEVNDVTEYPNDGQKVNVAIDVETPPVVKGSLVYEDEKRSYE